MYPEKALVRRAANPAKTALTKVSDPEIILFAFVTIIPERFRRITTLAVRSLPAAAAAPPLFSSSRLQGHRFVGGRECVWHPVGVKGKI